MTKNTYSGKVWFTSDHHHGHENILWLGGGRPPFKTIIEHDQALIANHNAVVSDNDTVYNLGDWSYRCSPEYATNCLEKSNGKWIFFLGNHEKPIRQAYKMGLLANMLKNGKLTIVGDKEVIYDDKMYISKVLEINGRRFFVGHCAHRSWPHAFRDCIHLFGHSHSRLGMFYKSMDVGVDAAEPMYYPIEVSKIVEKMDAIIEPFTEDGNLKYKQDNEEGKE